MTYGLIVLALMIVFASIVAIIERSMSPPRLTRTPQNGVLPNGVTDIFPPDSSKMMMDANAFTNLTNTLVPAATARYSVNGLLVNGVAEVTFDRNTNVLEGLLMTLRVPPLQGDPNAKASEIVEIVSLFPSPSLDNALVSYGQREIVLMRGSAAVGSAAQGSRYTLSLDGKRYDIVPTA